MDIDEVVGKRGGRGRGRSRGRGSRGGRGRGRGRGKKVAVRVVSSEEENSQELLSTKLPLTTKELQQVLIPGGQQSPNILQSSPAALALIKDSLLIKESLHNKNNNTTIVDMTVATTVIEEQTESSLPAAAQPQTIDMEADISQLEAPTFTTISRGPPEPMLRLKWDHKVSLIGEKVLNPMIHGCDQCDKPILVYGRMIPCKHVFCLKCARVEPIKACPRCKDKVIRVEQSGLGTVFMCIHGGSRYGNTGCRRTYLSQRDLQAHINHRHVTQATTIPADKCVIKSTIIADTKLLQPRKLCESNNTNVSSPISSTCTSNRIQLTQQTTTRPLLQSAAASSLSSSSSIIAGANNVVHQILTPISAGRNNIMTSSKNLTNNTSNNSHIQDIQHVLGKVSIQQQSVTVPPPSILNQHAGHHGPPLSMPKETMAAYYNSTTLQSYSNATTGTYSVPTSQPIITQNYGTISSITPHPNAAIMTMQMQGGGRPPLPNVPPPPPQNAPSSPFYPFNQQFGQMPPPPAAHYQFDPSNNQQSWNQQQYYR